MRLWHKSLIQYLPRQQLLAQWRECCAICSNWANKGTPNHLLVNKVMNYSKADFHIYTELVLAEFTTRGYKVSESSLKKFNENYLNIPDEKSCEKGLFEDWHNDRYLRQCLFNLQEKYDCGGIPEEEWKVIEYHFGGMLEWR